ASWLNRTERSCFADSDCLIGIYATPPELSLSSRKSVFSRSAGLLRRRRSFNPLIGTVPPPRRAPEFPRLFGAFGQRRHVFEGSGESYLLMLYARQKHRIKSRPGRVL